MLWISERSAPCQLWWSKHWLNSSMKVLLAQLSLSYIKANKINRPCQMVFMNMSNFKKSYVSNQIIGRASLIRITQTFPKKISLKYILSSTHHNFLGEIWLVDYFSLLTDSKQQCTWWKHFSYFLTSWKKYFQMIKILIWK